MPRVRKIGSFAADVGTFVKLTKIKADQVLRKVAFDCFAGIVMATPVDTGRARGSWHIAVNRTITATAPEVPSSSSVGTGSGTPTKPPGTPGQSSEQTTEAMAMSRSAKFGDSIFITNNLPYIVSLERGTSKQSAAGAMVSGTIQRIESEFAATVMAAKLRIKSD